MRRWMFVMIGMAVAAGISFPAAAGSAPEAEAPKTQQPAAATVQTAPAVAEGLVVFIDPDTGKKTSRPTAEQRAAMQARLANALSQSDEGSFDEVLPNGAVLRDLQGRFQSAVVVRVNDDGTRAATCVESVEALAAAVKTPAEPVPSAVETE